MCTNIGLKYLYVVGKHKTLIHPTSIFYSAILKWQRHFTFLLQKHRLLIHFTYYLFLSFTSVLIVCPNTETPNITLHLEGFDTEVLLEQK